ncbi:protein-tyrosine-phosphatase MKP1-like [Dioscorea cayenensis subsp. rotundata]|uniref:Protein-tyrosine-phosphatase MKP1-like n=1 Tax=Dioscorea cayennensis subsp. rotundata TaxID=55577 RepID=A0AB40C0X7_DIOCR|nr:protein-tyrosine-phosphatase MKP1-like [Dioscorea cayenensis subsp. rotundata]
MTLMDSSDDTSTSASATGTGTPKKSLFRSATWTARSPKPGRPSLPPLQPLRRPNLTEWPLPGSDDCPHAHPPSTPSTSSLSRVVDHVYLGSDAAARDRDGLRRHGITHVLNCVGSACPEYFRGDLIYKTLWLHDSPAEDITSVLYDAFDYLEDVRSARPPGRVLVHCLRGASRSATLVIAYLMWRYAKSFDEALRQVRAARAVTDPNLGFASQLLQCQSRVHALPPSPGSALRAYRMAPHSPYDSLHLVPKAVDRPSPARLLDSRGAFVVHVPTAIFVWIGVACEPVMAASASVAASQVVRYERAQGPVVTVQEGSEPAEFWIALMENPAISDQGLNLDIGEPGKRRVELFDLDFEIFRRALKGGVVPPFPMPGSSSETRLPARENGWNLLRHKFLSGGAKQLATALAVSPRDEENSSDSFRSPVSFSGEMSSTPSSTSADSASTRSTFSPASSSSSDWFNISPPSSKLCVSPAPKVISGLPPLCPGKEKTKVVSSATVSSGYSLPSLAETARKHSPYISDVSRC